MVVLLFGHDHNFSGKENGESVFDGYKSIPRCYDGLTILLVERHTKMCFIGRDNKRPDTLFIDRKKSGITRRKS